MAVVNTSPGPCPRALGGTVTSTRLLTSLFLKDVSDFFFDNVRRERMKDRLRGDRGSAHERAVR
jgi:hypothetical protein